MRVAGFGFRAGATLAALRAVLDAVEAQGGKAEALASLPAKAAAQPLRALAAERGLRVYAVTVQGVVTPTQSARVKALYGTGSVAEAAALCAAAQCAAAEYAVAQCAVALCAAGTGAAGGGARITVARIADADGMATCAMAEQVGEAE
ncbi:MAG: cobalamin biosynthesis protein [Rhodobacterales bacterium]